MNIQANSLVQGTSVETLKVENVSPLTSTIIKTIETFENYAEAKKTLDRLRNDENPYYPMDDFNKCAICKSFIKKGAFEEAAALAKEMAISSPEDTASKNYKQIVCLDFIKNWRFQEALELAKEINPFFYGEPIIAFMEKSAYPQVVALAQTHPENSFKQDVCTALIENKAYFEAACLAQGISDEDIQVQICTALIKEDAYTEVIQLARNFSISNKLAICKILIAKEQYGTFSALANYLPCDIHFTQLITEVCRALIYEEKYDGAFDIAKDLFSSKMLASHHVLDIAGVLSEKGQAGLSVDLMEVCSEGSDQPTKKRKLEHRVSECLFTLFNFEFS